MILIICMCILFFALCSPYLYSCITWNYSLAFFSLLSLYTNFVVFIVLLIVYHLIPTTRVDYLFQSITKWFRNAFSEMILKTEHNIKETFKIHILYPIPERSINIWHPHGMSGVTPVIHNGYRITNPDYIPTKGVVHYGYFMLPFIKDIIPLLNAVPSDEYSIRDTLEHES